MTQHQRAYDTLLSDHELLPCVTLSDLFTAQQYIIYVSAVTPPNYLALTL